MHQQVTAINVCNQCPLHTQYYRKYQMLSSYNYWPSQRLKVIYAVFYSQLPTITCSTV